MYLGYENKIHSFIQVVLKLTTRPTIFFKCDFFMIRRVWRYQMGNQNPYIEEGQTTQWPKKQVQKDKQRSTKHTYNVLINIR